MSDHPAVDYLRRIFGPSTEHPVFLCSLPNDKNVGDRGVRSLHTREPQDVYAFVNGHDRPGRGIYHAMSTITAGRQRNKANCLETPALVVDLDFKDIASPSAGVRGVLEQLMCPPTCINHTGHGFHVVWQFREAVPAQEYMERLESALRRLCDVIGGDLAVAHPAALLRLPGTHNTKNGEHTEVAVVAWSGRTYELDDLEDWLDIQSPVIKRKAMVHSIVHSMVHSMNGHGQESNPYLAAAAQLNFRPPIDVEQRLEQMTYQGAGEAGVHVTQLQVSASLVKHGVAFSDITDLLLAATQCAAGADGTNWDWRRERRNIERMCITAEEKFGHGEEKSEQKDEQTEMVDEVGAEAKGAIAGGEEATEPVERSPDPAEPTADVIDLGAARQAVAAQVKRVAQHAGKGKKFIVVAAAIKANLKAIGEAFFFGQKQTCWWYRKEIWQPVDDFGHWIGVETEIAAAELRLVCDNKLAGEVRGSLKRDPELQRSQDPAWDAHGKVPTVSGLIDPVTLEICPATAEQFCTWQIPWTFDPAAKCPHWLQMLEDCFGDLNPDERHRTITSLQELLGCGLIDVRARGLRRALILIGGPNTGKSAILEVFLALFGAAITAEFETIEGPHGLMPFRTRLPWIVREAFDQSDWHPSARVKTLITGEPLSVNIKNGPIVTTCWSGPVYFASNHPVQFRENTAAIVSRIVPIHCRTMFDDGNLVGVARLARERGFVGPGQFIAATEMPGVLTWAMAGLRRALQRGSILLSADSMAEKESIYRESNLVKAFFEDCVTFSPQYRIQNPDLFLAIVSWVAANRAEGGGRLPSGDQIGRAIMALHDKRILRHKGAKGQRWTVGVWLNEQGLEHFERGKSARIYEGRNVMVSSGNPNCLVQSEVGEALEGGTLGGTKSGNPSATQSGGTMDLSASLSATPSASRDFSRKPRF